MNEDYKKIVERALYHSEFVSDEGGTVVSVADIRIPVVGTVMNLPEAGKGIVDVQVKYYNDFVTEADARRAMESAQKSLSDLVRYTHKDASHFSQSEYAEDVETGEDILIGSTTYTLDRKRMVSPYVSSGLAGNVISFVEGD